MKHMEISYLSADSLKIKGKQITVLVNPDTSVKTPADVSLFFNKPQNPVKNPDVRLIIEGPGDYEVGGVKITGGYIGSSLYYNIIIDGVDMFTAKISSLKKAKEAVREYAVVLLQADSLLEQAVGTALNPSVFLFWGEQAVINAKALGKEDMASKSKFSITRDKLPNETEIVVLQ